MTKAIGCAGGGFDVAARSRDGDCIKREEWDGG